MLDVIVLIVREDQDIVEVDDNEFEHNVLEDIVDEMLEAGGSVRETETHDKRLKKTLGRSEGSLPFIPFPDPDVIVSPT